MPSTNHADIAEIIRKSVGLESLHMEQIIGRGRTNEVIVVTTAVGRLVVRLNALAHLSNFVKEAWCLQEAKKRGVLVPTVIQCGVHLQHSYSVAHFLEGCRNIESGDDRGRVWQRLGSYAASINRIPISGCGSHMSSAGHFSATWPEIVVQDIESAFRDDFWRSRRGLTSKENALLRNELESVSQIEAPIGICLTDLSCENTMIYRDNYDELYLIDLEWAVTAPVPQYQFAYAAKYFGLSDAFCRGYGITSNELSDISSEVMRLTVLAAMKAAQEARDNHHLINRAQQLIDELLCMDTKSLI